MTAKSHSDDPLIGARLGDYAISELLGRGGMARVYLGLDENLSRRSAVKVLSILTEDTEDERIVERFKLEARAIASFEHPNIVTIYQYGETDTLFFIAMKLVEGQSLSNFLRDHRRRGELLPVEQMLKMVNDVCNALDYAHARGIVHRDIKPSNILFDKNQSERAILTDFGLAMELGAGSTRGTAFGTPRYIAPEQAVSSQQAVPQSDIYSLAVVVFEILTGQVPFQDDSPMSIALSHITSEPPRPRSINPAIPDEVEAVVLKALAKEPGDRYPTAGEFYRALEAAYVSAEVEMPTLAVQPPSKLAPKMPVQSAAQVKTPAEAPAVKSKPMGKAASKPAPAAVEEAPAGKSRAGDNKAAAKAAAPKKRGRGTKQAPAAQAAVPEVSVPEVSAPEPTPRPRRRWLAVLIVLVALVGGALLALNAVGLIQLIPLHGRAALGIPAEAELPVELIYNDGGLAIYNDSAYPIPLDGLVLDWGANRKLRLADFHGPLPSGRCIFVRVLADVSRRAPAVCDAPDYALRMVPTAAALPWAGGSLAETLRVTFDGGELAACTVADGRCTFLIP